MAESRWWCWICVSHVEQMFIKIEFYVYKKVKSIEIQDMTDALPYLGLATLNMLE